MAWAERRRWAGYHGNASAVTQTAKVIPKIVSGNGLFFAVVDILGNIFSITFKYTSCTGAHLVECALPIKRIEKPLHGTLRAFIREPDAISLSAPAKRSL